MIKIKDIKQYLTPSIYNSLTQDNLFALLENDVITIVKQYSNITLEVNYPIEYNRYLAYIYTKLVGDSNLEGISTDTFNSIKSNYKTAIDYFSSLKVNASGQTFTVSNSYGTLLNKDFEVR